MRAASVVEGWVDRLAEADGVTRARVAILRSFTVEPLLPALRAQALRQRLALTVEPGAFEQFEQAILGGDLAATAPEAVVLAFRLRELAPELDSGLAALAPTRRAELAAAVVERVTGWISGLREQLPEARLFVLGLAAPRSTDGESQLTAELNRRLHAVCQDQTDAFFLDLDQVLSGVGYERVWDDRMEAHARQPFSAEALSALARTLARALAAALTPRRKCLVLDCDNTLWGGILGEDGADGIALGDGHPGSAFVGFQQAILRLHTRGVILALASRNNESDVLEVVDSHPHQVLRREHLAAWRINWNDKATSLVELADEINIGLDSIVFVDDSDFECDLVRRRLPEVLTRKTPADPRALDQFVAEMAEFDVLSVSAEDRARGEMYRAQAARNRARAAVASLDEFLESLEMRLEVQPTGPPEIERVAQLTQRTNQFNLTTRRYTPARIQEILDDRQWQGFHVRLADRFGDYGLCGVCLLRRDGEEIAVDTFLLSCRVIGRSVEGAAVAFLQRWARSQGAAVLVAAYVPTAKNALVADLWERLGFAPGPETGEASTWRWPTDAPPLEYPGYFDLDLPELKEAGK